MPNSTKIFQIFFLTHQLPVTTYLCFKIGLKSAVFGCLTNSIVPLPIVLESCSNPQKTLQVFESAMKKKFFGFGFHVFCE